MTNFATYALLGSPAASLVGKDKGDVSNRTKCAGAQLVNNAKNVGTDLLVIGGTTVAAGAVIKNKGLAKGLAKVFDKVKKAIHYFRYSRGCQNLLNKPFIKKMVKQFETAPRMYAPGLILVAAIGLGTMSLVNRKHNYKRGQIDQKYTDKAKIEKQTKDMV